MMAAFETTAPTGNIMNPFRTTGSRAASRHCKFTSSDWGNKPLLTVWNVEPNVGLSFNKANKWLYVCLRLERRLHFLWITAAAQSDSFTRKTSCHQHWPELKGGLLLVHIMTSSSENLSDVFGFKKWPDLLLYFPPRWAQWTLDGRRLSKTDAFPCGKLRGRLQNVFYWLFSINRKIFTDFWKLSREKKHF